MVGRPKEISMDDRLDIVKAYKGGESLKNIERCTGLAQYTIKRILIEEGVEGVKQNKPKAKNEFKICSCGNKNQANAKYCFICGKQIKTEEEKIIDGLLAARTLATKYAPDANKKEIDEQIMAAVNLLKTKCGVK